MEKISNKLARALARTKINRAPTRRKRYNVKFFQEPKHESDQPEGSNGPDWWFAYIKEYDALTQGRTLMEAAIMAEDLIRCWDSIEEEESTKPQTQP